MKASSKVLVPSLLVLGWAALGESASAITDTVRWLKMAPTPFGTSVPNNSVFNVPGVGNVTVTYSLPAVMTDSRLQNPLLLNGSLVSGPDTFAWSTQELFSTIFTVGPDPLVPLPWTITYTFPSTLPCGSVYVGVSGLGQTSSFGGGKSTITVNQDGTFLGDWSGGGNYGPTLFTGGVGTFTMENSLTGAGGLDPWWNTPLGVVRIDDAVNSITLTGSQIRGDGVGVNIGFSKSLASDRRFAWMKMPPTGFGASIPNNSVFNLPGVGNVTVTYSLPPEMSNSRLQNALLLNGLVSNAGTNYAWGYHELFTTIFTVGPDPLVPLPWTITYTFPSTLPCGSIYLGVSGLGKTTSFGGGASTATVNQSGTFLGDWSGGGNSGPTLFTGGAGSFTMENSLSGPGGLDPWWNTSLGVVRIDDAVSSLTVDFSQIRGDGIGLNIAYAHPTWCDLDSGLAGTNDVPVLVGSGTLQGGSPGALTLTSANPSSLAILFASLSSTAVPFKGGTVLAFPFVLSLNLATNSAGAISLPWGAWPTGLPDETALYFQYAVQDPAAIKGVALSNAVQGVTP